MQLATIIIAPEEAEARAKEYASIVAAERTAEDEAILAGYRAAARGLPIVRLSDCIRNGGWFDNGLPKIAICRADATKCWVEYSWRTSMLTFSADESTRGRSALVGRNHVAIPDIELPDGQHRWGRGSTIVPPVPPEHRPKRPGRLGRLHVLWEVESWTREPPIDPALLRHIRGDLWSVLAVWDLSELERAVLAQRA